MSTSAITTENLLPGTNMWQFNKLASTRMQAYADKTAYNPGDTVTFFVSVQVNGTLYNLNIYRLGWYRGTGGCLKYTNNGLTGVAQGVWDNSSQTLIGGSALIDSSTHLCDANYSASTTWVIPGGACTGVYMAQFTDANGYQCACTFVVRGSVTSDYVVSRGYTTDAAYNSWGGYSLYTNPTVGTKVSFNRPNLSNGGASNVLAYDLTAIHWLEMMGYDLAYISDIDLHTSGTNPLLMHKAYLSLGHDEYWTKEMRANVLAARDASVGLGFLGANAIYWQCRLENDAASNANRTVVCYKVTTAANNLATDPLYGVDNTRVTTNWRDAVLNLPENALIGMMYSDNSNTGNFAWTVDSNAGSLGIVAGTGLTPGQSYGFDLVGYEWDRITNNGLTPTGIQTIATSATVGVAGVGNSNTTLYQAASGAWVFATGSIGWMGALDPYRYNPQAGGYPTVIQPMKQLMVNVMTKLLAAKTPTSVQYGSFLLHA